MVGLISRPRARWFIDKFRHGWPRRIVRLSRSIRRAPRFEWAVLRGYSEFVEHLQRHGADIEEERRVPATTAGTSPRILTAGYCICCRRTTNFWTNWSPHGNAPGAIPHWREGLVCPHCGLNSRMRASVHLMLRALGPRRSSRIYLTEQVTSLFRWFEQQYPRTTGSEFLRDGTPRGGTNAAGIRHEDLTALSFPDRCFDIIVSLEVMEHVPDFQKALAECARVLAPGGKLLLSVPFHGGPNHRVRARLRGDGSIEHLLAPQYHGDPLDPHGCLSFHDFGWDLLGFLKEAGFRRAVAYAIWSRKLGYYIGGGTDLVQFVAER